MRKVTEITALTETTIECLLDGDIPLSIDRKGYEDYITEGTGKYEYQLDHYEPVTGHRQTNHVIELSEYWQDCIGMTLHVDHINDYIEQDAKAKQDITMAELVDFVKHDMNTDLETDILLLQSKVLHFAHMYFLRQYNDQPSIIGTGGKLS